MGPRAPARPVHRAIVWQDRRTAARCDELRDAGHLDLVRRTTGPGARPVLLGVQAGVAAAPRAGSPLHDGLAFGTVDSWLLWNLTGGRADAGAVHATDVSNASRTLLFDIRSRSWSPELCALFGVPESLLPEVRPSSGRFGVTAGHVAGVGAGVPVSGIAGDQQAALFGQACFEPGMTKNTYGTGLVRADERGRDVPRAGRRPADHHRLDHPVGRPGRYRARAARRGDVTHYALEGPSS